MSGPGLPPRPRPGGVKAPLPAPPGTPDQPSRSSGGAPPPLPAPRSSVVSSLAKNFGGTGGNANASSPVGNHGGGPPVKPSGPPPHLPSAPRPSIHAQQQAPAESSPTSTRPAPVPRSSAPALPPERSQPNTGSAPALPPERPLPRTNSTERPQPRASTTERPQPRASTSEGEGFGSCLQNCYDTITKRHEDELLALESLRNHVFNRARLDKEYADNLAKTNAKAQRKMVNVGNKASAIVQAWLCFLEMSEAIQKQLSNGAAQMSGVLLHAVDTLIKDKRGAKTAFDQNRLKMDNECNASCKAAQELRRVYIHCAKNTDLNKKKLEAAMAKDPPRLADQEKFRKRFVQNAEKLHTIHNEYTLALINANIHIDHHRTSLLPFCLDTLQQRMELQITRWKDALLNYTNTVDFSKTYEEKFQQLYNSLKQVEEESEYVEFIRENKKETPQVEYYEFDTGLLSEPCAPQVEAGQLVLDNLTHAALQMRITAIENEMELHNREIEIKQEELASLVNGNGDSNPTSPSKDSQQSLPKHVQESNLKAMIRDFECINHRRKDQLDLVQAALVSLPEDESPPLFHELGEGVDPKDLDMSQALSTSTNMGKKSRGLSMSSGKFGLTLSRGFKKIGKQIRGKGRLTSRSSDGAPNVAEVAVDGGAEDDSEDEDSTYDVPPDIPVEEEDWYYGDIDRKVAESKCKTSGDYIVRYSERQNKYVLTCNWKGQGKHFVIQQFVDENGSKMFRFEAKSFATIKTLLDYHCESGTTVTRASESVIIKPVPKHDKWSMSHDKVKIGKKIGKGAFGEVFEAFLNNEKVAVKTCKSSDLADTEKFMMEADILKQYGHPNVVRLLGVCADDEPVYIVMEFMPGGALLDFLRKKGSHQTKKKLCSMCVDASRGMAYLESKNCIHRDLAARNCLVGDSDIVKISDFGMSREDEGGIYIVSSGTRQIPIKWTAPEALNYGKYSSPSDVWSFGVLLWEVYSCGSAPYPGMSNHDARSQIELGYRMPPPADCPDEVYGVMQQCWQYDPEERPDFSTILDMLTKADKMIKT